jgi:hypothetical protein
MLSNFSNINNTFNNSEYSLIDIISYSLTISDSKFEKN